MFLNIVGSMPSSSACDQTQLCAALRRLLHHVAELTGQRQPLAVREAAWLRCRGHRRRFPSRPVRSPRPAGDVLAHFVLRERLRTEHFDQVLRPDVDRLRVAFRESQRDLAGESADRPLQPAQSRFPRVARISARIVSSGMMACSASRPRLAQLPRNQVLLRDLNLLLFGVAGKPQDFHTVEQRPRESCPAYSPS